MQDPHETYPLNILFVFIDGVGLGGEHADNNPFCQLSLPGFERLSKNQRWTDAAENVRLPGHTFHPIDACLSVEGLPQSGTGQATLFTGVNCAAIAGRHFGPYPHSTSKPIIAKENIFTQVNQLFSAHEAPSAFANAYPEVFFNHAKAKNRWTVTTLACLESGIKIRKENDVRNEEAITAEITGQAWHDRLNIDILPIPEDEAARRLVNLASRHAFTLFEYYLTDKAGHSRDMDKATQVLRSLDSFFEGILAHADFDNTLLIVTSDHGNLEDLSIKPHTFNDVPLIAMGKGADLFQKTTSIQDITPAIMETLRSFTRKS